MVVVGLEVMLMIMVVVLTNVYRSWTGER